MSSLGSCSEPFRLTATNATRTLWSLDVYGNDLVYFEHRFYGGTHGVFPLTLPGMDVKICSDSESATTESLECNVIGGVFDFWILAGSETDLAEVERQYAQIAGTPG